MSIAANKVAGVRAALVADEQTASLARQHNNANVLCLAAKTTVPEMARRSWRPFSARASKADATNGASRRWETQFIHRDLKLKNIDPQIAGAIEHERVRQQENIELIARKISPAGRDGSAGLGADEQVRRRLSEETLVRRL